MDLPFWVPLVVFSPPPEAQAIQADGSRGGLGVGCTGHVRDLNPMWPWLFHIMPLCNSPYLCSAWFSRFRGPPNGHLMRRRRRVLKPRLMKRFLQPCSCPLLGQYRRKSSLCTDGTIRIFPKSDDSLVLERKSIMVTDTRTSDPSLSGMNLHMSNRWH